MASQRKNSTGFGQLLSLGTLVLIGVLIPYGPARVLAEGNEPTATATFTPTLVPSETPQPEAVTNQEEPNLESKGIELDENASGSSLDEDTTGTAPDENAASVTGSKSPTGGLYGTNLCLIGAIVVAATIVMFMVVYGVVQRVRS